MALDSPVRRRLLLGAAITVGACALAWLVAATGFQARYERIFYDQWHNIVGVRVAPTHTALVTIDEATLAAHRHEPLVTWGPHFADAIAVLRAAGASVIAIDFQFASSVEEWLGRMGITADGIARTHDARFREQLAGGRVLLVGAANIDETASESMLLPIPDYLYSLPNNLGDVGLANLVTDDDGVVRHFMTAVYDEGPAPRLTLGMLAALRAAGLDPTRPPWTLRSNELSGRAERHRIYWSGPSGTVPTISFQRLLVPGALQDPDVAALRGKVVIVGSDHMGLHDFHLTPYGTGVLGGVRAMMSGPEIQANIVETLLSGRSMRAVPPPAAICLMLLIVAVGTWLCFLLRPLPAAATTLALVVLAGVAGYTAFLFDRVLAIGPTQVALGLAYVGTLAARFTGEARRREETVRMFGRYVSDEVVDHLSRLGRLPDLGGETATATVLFTDIREFTTFSERLDAQEVVTMLNAFFSRAVEPILENGGTVDKFVGDAIMAVFGSPVPYEDHARRALKAALEMKRVGEEFRGWMTANHHDRDLPGFAIGIGVHSGDVVTGNVGSPRRMQFTVIGDTVNTASRLEGLTKVMGTPILISGAVASAAGDDLLLGAAESVVVKGRAAPVEVFEFLGFEPQSDGAES